MLTISNLRIAYLVVLLILLKNSNKEKYLHSGYGKILDNG